MSKMLSVAALGMGLLITPAFAAHDEADATKAVETFTANYLKLWNAQDAAGVAALFVDDGMEIPPTQPVTGRDNIEKWFASIFKAGATDLRYDEITRVQPEGNVVLAVGQFTVKLPAAGGGPVRDVHGNFVNVYEWNGDDLRYRIHAYNFIPEQQR